MEKRKIEEWKLSRNKFIFQLLANPDDFIRRDFFLINPNSRKHKYSGSIQQ